MKTEHLKLYLSKGRPQDAVEAIQNKIITEAKETLESIKDPETLLAERQSLRSKKEQLQDDIKRQKTAIAKSNKKREAMLAQWSSFVIGVSELARKHGVDFEQFPAHLASGRTFIQKLQNIKPDSFVQVEGLRIPQKKTEALLDDELIKLFEIEAKQEELENIIARKAKAMKELFSSEPK